MAHELRTPLTSLRGHIESILLDDSLPEQHRGALAVALDSADTLADLVNRMLFLARADRGTCEDMKRGKVDLNSLILETCALVFPDEEERRGRLTVDLPEPIALVADHDMIFRLVLNLVDNAKRHTPAGAAIAIQAHRQGESVTLTVADRGAGVGDGDRERIFEKFYSYTCKDAGRARAGTGLGLAICRSIARLHGGDVCCTETPGGGATFIAKISRDDSMSG